MIGYIKGTIEEISEDSVIIDNHGMGYVVKVPLPVLEGLRLDGQEVKLYTYLYVREDQIGLFGFENANQLHMFELLLTVNGIGPKVALGILSTLSVSALMMAIVSQDAKAISKAPGIGAKSAQKLILELKDKVAAEDILYQEVAQTSEMAEMTADTSRKEACLALVSLGYDQTTASRAVAKVTDWEQKDTETILKEALKFMLV
ncbi:MAG: Holliday junction branch migration protein RuvA [Lachnospiraceae bacterium]|nr:Holliday junction branch migration protein RuvA [Lachnospiraceae bacterium]